MATGITGQLYPLVVQPGDRISIVAASMTTDPGTAAGVYTFNEGVGCHIARDAPDFTEASDFGTLVAVPELASLLASSFVFLIMLPLRSHREYRRTVEPTAAVAPPTVRDPLNIDNACDIFVGSGMTSTCVR